MRQRLALVFAVLAIAGTQAAPASAEGEGWGSDWGCIFYCS